MPQIEQIHHIPESERFCPCCGLPLEELNSEEISYEVTVDVTYSLICHRRKKYRKTCRCPSPIVRAPSPIRLFPQGLYSIDFWIKVLLDKYAHGIPLNRQITIMQLEGFSPAPATLCDGLSKIASFLEPLYTRMLEEIAFAHLVHADETSWKNWAHVYDHHRSDEKSLHWLWGFFSELFHVFVIDPTRAAAVIKRTFGQGDADTVLPLFITDRYKAYIAACGFLAFCWSHVRRDFLTLQTKYPYDKELYDWAEMYLNLIRDLYCLNQLRLSHDEGSELFNAFQSQMQTTLDTMHSFNTAPYKDKRKHKQAQSMINHWQGLTLFMQFPEIPLDNNLAERQLRSPVIGRKNFYGTHSDAMTKATAVLYSIIATAKLHNVNLKRFLHRYLTFCAIHQKAPPSKLLNTFLPHRYAKIYPEDLL